MTVYIEGDGFAWKTRYQPSMDPTPDDAMSLKLALSDVTGNAAYLARPCQFTMEMDRRRCHTAYWTTARYSKPVIDSMDEAVSALKRASNAQSIRLVGYSGGGVVAALLAARRPDVVQLVTLAANLDTAYWTRLHGVTPLYDSLNPATLPSLKTVPQMHFVGADDQIVPQSVLVSYLHAIGRDPKTSLRSLSGVDHTCCWSDMWPKLQQQLINSR
ncbi:alpha/beta hydrolase [Magnetovibrio sp.]|uniref:alpha/beta fold hydrolase n=1 Tax=Magnetovibrio sp. TaxID=2024836 RepID=UPI002F93868B